MPVELGIRRRGGPVYPISCYFELNYGRRSAARRDPYSSSVIDDRDRRYLRRCVELARTALDGGDRPFAAVLVDADGGVLTEDHNHASTGDPTQHAEFALARWSAQHLTAEQRASATVYTSSEHCPMCSAAHGWVGLGRIVYASSTHQLASWLAAMGAPAWPVRPLPINEISSPGISVDGPVAEFAEELHQLHLAHYLGRDARGDG